MKPTLKLLLTTSFLITPSVFGNSSAVFGEDYSSAHFESCSSLFSFDKADESISNFHSCASLSSLDEEEAVLDKENKSAALLSDAVVEKVPANEAFRKALAQHAGTFAYKAMLPKMKSILWVELNKLLNGAGMYALAADGQRLPVVRGTFDGLLDLILNSLNVNSSIRSGINLATTISGHKPLIEKELKRLLGIDSLEALVERLAQEIVLRSMGVAIDAYESTAKPLTLAEIRNEQEVTSLKDGRVDTLANRTANADLNFATGYVWYEFKNMINIAASVAINNHIEQARASTISSVAKNLGVFTVGVSGCLAVSGAPGVLAAAGLLTLNHNYGDLITTAAYDVFNHVVIDGFAGARNIALLPISTKEIEQFHPVAVTIETEDIEDDMVKISVNKKSFGQIFVKGVASNVVSSAASKALKVVSSLTKGFSFWGVR